MNELEIIEEFNNRSKSVRKYRETAALLLVVSIILLALYGVNQTRLGMGGGVLLGVGVVLLVVCFALALLSFIKLRCPNCHRILGEVHDAAFCPSCGVALKSDASFGLDSPPEEERGGRGAGKLAKRQESTRRTAIRAWEPRSGQPGIDPFPEEAYPKNIRMFTTKDELELTKRYIHLIDNDNSRPQMQQDGGLGQESAGAKSASARKSKAERKAEKTEGGPSWRQSDDEKNEREIVRWSFVNRLLDRIRRL
jgi:hypothetical protein